MTRVITQTQIMRTTKARRPLRTAGAGRPGGSGAQPPLHLIYMVKVGSRVIRVFVQSRESAPFKVILSFLLFRLRQALYTFSFPLRELLF